MAEETSLAALQALRAWLIAEKRAPEEASEDYVLAGGARFPKTTRTPVSSSNNFLPLNALVHAWSTADLPVGQYIRDARTNNVARLAHLDRPDVLGYLKGEKDWSSRISAEPPQSGQAPASGEVAAAQGAKAADNKAASAPRAGADAEDAGKKRKKGDTLSPEELLLRKIKKREGSQRDRDSVLQSSQRFMDALMIEREMKRSRNRAQATLSATSQAFASGKAVPKGIPIIVVPAAPTAPINMFNAKMFLEQGKYVHPDKARKVVRVKPQAEVIERRVGDSGVLRFKVVDSVRKFQDQHWDRVAAVFTQGPTWQFKDWRWKDTATIFDNCRGVHVYFDDQKLEPHIRDWNVVKFTLKKQSRHQDAVEVHKIWMELERFLNTKKPELVVAARVKSGLK